MTLSSSLNNIKIRNNSVDIGKFSNGTTTADYTYSSLLKIGGDATITGNSFSGCIGGSSSSADLLAIASASCDILGNVFVRGAGSPLHAYINISGTNDQIIKDNIFDQSTVDGTDEDLVKGLNNTSIYHSNKNQISYFAVSLLDGKYNTDLISPAIGGSLIPTDSNLTTNYISFNITGSATRAQNFFMDISSILPEGVQILDAKIGIWASLSGFVLAGGFPLSILQLKMSVQDIVKANYGTGLNSILDSKNKSITTVQTVSSTAYNLLTNAAAVAASTQYVSVSTGTDNFKVGKNTSISLTVILNTNLSSGSLQYDLSPVVCRCIW